MTTQAKPTAPAPPVPQVPATTPAVPDAPAYTPQTRKFTVAEYYRLAEVGILKPEERVELIEGEIIVMPPIGPAHADEVNQLTAVFGPHAPDRYRLSIQNPVHLNDGSEPQPDAALLRQRPDGYRAAHPTPADVLLIIEVADSSLAYDREVKAHLYGRHNIPETWVRNLPEDCIERFTEPGPNGYAQHTIHRRGETLTPVSLPDLAIAVADLLPPPPPEEAATGE